VYEPLKNDTGGVGEPLVCDSGANDDDDDDDGACSYA
jgi:hypothetical protein